MPNQKNDFAELTQIERIIVAMFQKPNQIWWVASDFMPPAMAMDHPLCVGYEATARLSDLITRYNKSDDNSEYEVFETKREQKFRLVRFRFEQMEESLKRFPELITLAEKTDILNVFSHVKAEVEQYRPVPKKAPVKFKSYAT